MITNHQTHEGHGIHTEDIIEIEPSDAESIAEFYFGEGNDGAYVDKIIDYYSFKISHEDLEKRYLKIAKSSPNRFIELMELFERKGLIDLDYWIEEHWSR